MMEWIGLNLHCPMWCGYLYLNLNELQVDEVKKISFSITLATFQVLTIHNISIQHKDSIVPV